MTLKIEIASDGEKATFRLSGRIEEDHLVELQAEVQRYRPRVAFDSVAAFALVIAFWAIFNGLTTTVHAFELRPVAPHWWVLLLSGLVGVAFGVAALYYYPGLSLTFAVVLVAWWLTITGAIGIYAAVQEKTLGLKWGWTAAFGGLSGAPGVSRDVAPHITV